LFVDKSNWGWFAWPRLVKVYRANKESPQLLFMRRPELTEAYTALQTIVHSPDFWQSYLRYCSQEGSSYSRQNDGGASAPEEVFSLSTVRVYKAIFQLFEDEFLYDLVAPTVQQWFANHEDKSQQRASAEFFAGIIQATKHWRWGALERLWKWMLPLVKRALLNCTPETLTFWYHGMRYACVSARVSIHIHLI
jgi:proteasome activator subunit 4